MTWQHRYELGDPARILERKQEREARQRERSKQGKAQRARAGLELLFTEGAMTQDQSEQMEALLETWFRFERAYMPNLGAPKVSPSCWGHQSSETQEDGDDRDAKLERITAEAVASCVDQLHYMERAAINVHMLNKVAGVTIHRNPRLGTVEQQHERYQEAKAKLWPIMKRKGLV